MNIIVVIAIGLGGALGALLRYRLGLVLNTLFPMIPLGTLAANLIGGLFMGIFMAISKDHAFIHPTLRLAITTGFLGGLTTFSTFSAETVTLLAYQEYFWSGMIILAHVAGTILATILGIYLAKIIYS